MVKVGDRITYEGTTDIMYVEWVSDKLIAGRVNGYQTVWNNIGLLIIDVPIEQCEFKPCNLWHDRDARCPFNDWTKPDCKRCLDVGKNNLFYHEALTKELNIYKNAFEYAIKDINSCVFTKERLSELYLEKAECKYSLDSKK